MTDEDDESYFYRGGKRIPLRRVSPGRGARAARGAARGEAYVQAGSAHDCLLIPTGEVVVQFASEVTPERALEELSGRGAHVERELGYLSNGYLARARAGPGEALRLANELHELPFVVAAEPNWIRRTPKR